MRKGAELMVEGSRRSPEGTLKVTFRAASVHTVLPAAGLVESTLMFVVLTGLMVVNVPT